MRYAKPVTLFALCIALAAIAFTAMSATQKKQHRIVFQYTNATDTLQQKAFVQQLENITTHWPQAKYQVVVYNQGVDLLMQRNTTYAQRLQALHGKGVRFVICENTLRNRKLSKDLFMQDIVGYVPAGIAEIVEKQEQGWSYIKGGF